jgi:Bacteriophage tail sheath protein
VAVTPTYPGVYIQELPSPVHPITGVATSIAAFVGLAQRGPVDTPTTVLSFADFTRTFGGLWANSTMSYAVNQFFQNGGTQAVIVRGADLTTGSPATKGTLSIGTLGLEAASEGAWSSALEVRIDLGSTDPTSLFNIWVRDTSTGALEVLRNLPASPAVTLMVEQQSALIRVATVPTALPTAPPPPNDKVQPGTDPFADSSLYNTLAPGGDGDLTTETDLIPGTDNGRGMYALAKADLFNLLCIPPIVPGGVLSDRGSPAKFCHGHYALFIVDSDPSWTDPNTALTDLGTFTSLIASEDLPYAALYFPQARAQDPLQNNAVVDFPTSGMIAGVMARTDAARGVWKAPAGLDAGLSGVQELNVKLTDGENGLLNPVGVNCLRTFPAAGNVVWGARTLAGADVLASQWKYVPVRRTANFIEVSLYQGTQWVVFEPNDEPLWAQIRLNVGSFMHDLFRQGAFQGTTPQDAYLVKCDKDTTTQTDINNGVVNILVGFAPLKPAEFVIIEIQQLAGQIQT